MRLIMGVTQNDDEDSTEIIMTNSSNLMRMSIIELGGGGNVYLNKGRLYSLICDLVDIYDELEDTEE